MPHVGTPADQRRASPIVQISGLLAECVQHRLRTLAFCKSRKLCELVAAYTREMLQARLVWHGVWQSRCVPCCSL
jgi:DEAD/DEAH box helicase domain-containing protein